MNKEHLKVVIWPKDKVSGLHKYVVVGMIVSEKSIEAFEGKDEVVIDNDTFGQLANMLELIPHRDAKIKVGDATDVLLNLKDI